MNGYTFSGSKIDRAFSFSKLNRLFDQAQTVRVSAPVRPVDAPGYSIQSLGQLHAVVGDYRSAFSGLFSSQSMDDSANVNLSGFGITGGIPLPPADFSSGISPEIMERRTGESHEEHIARITALIRAVTAAMLEAIDERTRKQKISAKKPKQQQAKLKIR